MQLYKNALFCFCLMMMGAFAFAQKPKPGSTNITQPTTQKYKAPKVKTILGTRSDTSVVAMDEALQLIGLPLRFTDEKKNNYTLSSYQFLYKRIGVTEDETTGRKSPTTSVVSQLFKTSPLSDIWIKTIRDELQPGEELYFFDVLLRDDKGRLFFATDLKLIIK